MLIYFLNTKESSGNLELAREIKPLEFDPALIANYLQCFDSTEKRLLFLDELEQLYEGVDNPGERLEWLELLSESGLSFEAEDEDNEA